MKISSYLRLLFLLVWLWSQLFLLPSQSYAAGINSLQVITNATQAYVPVTLSVAFSVPFLSTSISSTHYIQIELPNYSNVGTSPSFDVNGTYGGTPTHTVVGNTVRISGISVLPGNSIQIEGIQATNPDDPGEFNVIVNVTSDEAGLIILKSAQTLAADSGNVVSVSATIDAPVAALTITGYSGPGTFLTITEGAAVLGTETAIVSGYWAKYFNGLEGGYHTFTVYGKDPYDLVTAPHTVTVNLPVYQQTIINNILLSPTLSISDTQILPGDDLVASGTASPESTVTIFVDSPLRTYTASPSANGDWSYTISDTASFQIGDYSIFALAQDIVGRQSIFSLSQGFSVTSSQTSTGSACGDISKGDLNCDTEIDLADFSILMYYWGTNDKTADMNNDNQVNLTDFSVMMYYWGT